jgi:hypothetical protein
MRDSRDLPLSLFHMDIYIGYGGRELVIELILVLRLHITSRELMLV